MLRFRIGSLKIKEKQDGGWYPLVADDILIKKFVSFNNQRVSKNQHLFKYMRP